MSRVVFIFLDGVGLGPPGPHNPLSTAALPAFEELAGGQTWTADARPIDRDGHLFRPIDANLGVEGLPQSGTGQATLFTGINCAEVVGRHFGPFPHSETHPVIAQENVFGKVRALDLLHEEPAAFANAYPPRFFRFARKRKRWTVTTRCCMEAGVRVRSLEALLGGDALAADLTAAGWERIGHDVPPISEAEAGGRLLQISRRHAFTLFEYYLTDKAGHHRGDRRAADVLGSLNTFFEALLSGLRLEEELLLITSDHGNLEDLARKTHTRHPVPLIAYGHRANPFRTAENLTDVVPATVEALAA